MASTRSVHSHPCRSAFLSRLGNCETVEHLKSVVQDLVQAIPFRNEIADGSGRTIIKLDKSVPQTGTPLVCRVIAGPNSLGPAPTPAPSTDASGTISQELPQTDPTGSQSTAPGVSMCIRGYNNFQFTAASTLLDNVAYAPRIPSQELFFKVDVGGKTMYGRVPLMNNPDEAVPRPLIGWTGTLPDKTGALLQLHNDLVQSLLQLGVLRPVERPLADKISIGDLPH